MQFVHLIEDKMFKNSYNVQRIVNRSFRKRNISKSEDLVVESLVRIVSNGEIAH